MARSTTLTNWKLRYYKDVSSFPQNLYIQCTWGSWLSMWKTSGFLSHTIPNKVNVDIRIKCESKLSILLEENKSIYLLSTSREAFFPLISSCGSIS